MKKTLVYLLASLVMLMMSTQAYAAIEWSGNIMAGLEKMDYGTNTVPSDSVSDKLQFSNIKLNLDVKADICEGVAGVAQLRSVSSDVITALTTTTTTTGTITEGVKKWVNIITPRCVYIELGDPIIPATLQIGRIELPLGVELSTKLSDGANTMRNPLIFNSLLTEDVEKRAIDDGLLIAKKFGAVEGKLGITNGYDGNDTEAGLQPMCKDTNDDKAITLNLSGGVPAVPGLTLGGTYYTNDAADEPNEKDEVSKWIVDVGFQTGLLRLATAIGNEEQKTKVTTATTTTTRDTDYLVGEVVYGNGETPWWVAARYSTKKPTTKPAPDPKDDVKKLEFGVGYKLCESTYLKVEYVDVKVKDDVKDLKDYKGLKAIVNVAF